MARKKANYDPRQHACENEAKKIVSKWFKKQNLVTKDHALRIIWFAYIPRGFKCMITSDTYNNNFFEVTVNKVTGEIYCNCFQRFAYFVTPSNKTENIIISDDNFSLI